MSIYLDGALQGGGLTTIADVTVSGGAVTTMDTGAITLAENQLYNFCGEIKYIAACLVNIYNNGNTTTSNYETALIGSAGGGENLSAASAIGCTGTNAITHFTGTIMRTGVKCTLVLERYDRLDPSNGFIRYATSFDVNSVITTTSFQLTATVASAIDNGSWFKITEAY